MESLPKEPENPGFDLSEFAKWEDLQKDLWEEYLDKQANNYLLLLLHTYTDW